MASLIAGVSSCAVLTSSQVNEVKTFAKASEEYTALPGALVQSYGILLRNNKLLAVSRQEFGAKDSQGGIDTARANQAWEDIQEAYTLEYTFRGAAEQMDAALAVLKTYSQILTTLTSDNYTNALGESAAKLGKSLDAATDAYSQKYSAAKPLQKAGGAIAQGVRTAGGLYIRHRQIAILRDTVEAANPLIQGLMSQVEDIAANRLKPDFANYEKNYLGAEFKSVANNSQRLAVTTVSAVYDDLNRARRSAILADQVAAAAGTYKRAHERLVENTRERADLKQPITEIETLIKEVNEGTKVRRTVGG
jgi:DNA repair exonuclease SbcCD ATPase subunit